MTLDRFFPATAQRQVEEAVRAAEARSLGQVVPVVVERSAHYHEVRWVAAVAAAALVTLVVDLLFPEVTIRELPFLQLAGGLVGAVLGGWEPVERLLAGRREMEQAVRVRAEQAFLHHGLHRTASGTGVLVFASLREHQAVVLGDAGIHARMGDAEWQRAVDGLVAGIRRGEPAEGFVAAIAVVGERLAEHFPRGPGDKVPNELPDGLRQDPS
jgi:putative membrane protein